MDNQFPHRRPWIPWAFASVMLVVVAVAAYSIGVSQAPVQLDPGGARVVYRHAPWGFLWFFVVFWFIGGLRFLWWRPYVGGPWRYRRRYWRDWDDPHDEWHDWHRREHERMRESDRNQPPPPVQP